MTVELIDSQEPYPAEFDHDMNAPSLIGEALIGLALLTLVAVIVCVWLTQAGTIGA